MGTKPHIIVGCHLMSECTVQEIKFDTTKTTKFLDWLQKEKIFIEFDSLGIKKTTTVSYLTKIHPRLTNHTSLKLLLLISSMMLWSTCSSHASWTHHSNPNISRQCWMEIYSSQNPHTLKFTKHASAAAVTKIRSKLMWLEWSVPLIKAASWKRFFYAIQ